MKFTQSGAREMRSRLSKTSDLLKALWRDEAQDMVEYALVIALIGFGCTLASNSPAVSLNKAFTAISNGLNAKIT